MRIEPHSTISLYSGVDIDNGEQLAFSNRSNQASYFAGKLMASNVDCTIVRKTGALRVEISGSVISKCNYLSFINPSFDNKIVYARIIDYDYINNECSEITYAIDYWQTWMFDVKFENSYIEREMLSKSDEQKAEQNPYDPTIFEYRTNESLPISKDLEKFNYVIGNDSSTDGYKIGKAITQAVDVGDDMGVLIKLNAIDFTKLDQDFEGSPIADKPSYQFAQWLHQIVQEDFGFFKITDHMKYSLNGTGYPTINQYMIGPGWKDRNNTPIYPYKSSRYNPDCCIIYDPKGATYNNNSVSTNGHMSTFLNLMTRWNNVENIIDMSIIPNNLMIFAGIPDAYSGGHLFRPSQTMPNSQGIVNKKLMRYPFNYLRVMTPNGDVKEYRYEWFKDIATPGQNTSQIASLECLLDFSDKPVLMLAPRGYRYSQMSHSYGSDTNMLEAIYFDQFPTMPYTIDAFTAQVAAVANYTIGNKTVDNAADMAIWDTNTNETSQAIRTAQGMLGAASAGLTGSSSAIETAEKNPMTTTARGAGYIGAGLSAANGAAAAAGMYNVGAQMAMDRQKFEAASERWFGASTALSEGDGNVIAQQLRLAKPAYACDKYIASNGVGVTNFNIMSFCDVIFLRVSLAPEILDVYDKWFSHYGYSSGRCGIPRVVNYINGVTTETEVPAWKTVNGKETTYIKTMDCKITHSMLPVASYIKTMFDSGVRMIKGD